MYSPRFLLHAIVLTGLSVGPALLPAASRAAPAPAIAVDDFGYFDTSGEPTDQTAAHQRRLAAFMAAFNHDLTADGAYRLVVSSCTAPCQSDDRLHAASQAGANILILGAVKKLSTLVLWTKVTAIDLGANRVAVEKLYTFRGDNDLAWQQNESYVARDVRAALAAPVATTLAVSNFALEDLSAAASGGETAADATELANATSEVRRLLAQSGRYRVIDADGADAQAAFKAGAAQSFAGVIRRISRTEYTVRFQIRDISTGAVVSEGDSGLRMGANYSWSRGAARLVADRVIENGPRK